MEKETKSTRDGTGRRPAAQMSGPGEGVRCRASCSCGLLMAQAAVAADAGAALRIIRAQLAGAAGGDDRARGTHIFIDLRGIDPAARNFLDRQRDRQGRGHMAALDQRHIAFGRQADPLPEVFEGQSQFSTEGGDGELF